MLRSSLLILVVAACIQSLGCGGQQSNQSIAAQLEPAMRADMQTYFDQVHPIGTAKDLKLHTVTTVATEIGPAAEFVYTIYWEGPVQKDGFTKCLWVIDLESERTQDLIVLNTNGITNEQVGQWLKTGGKVAATALAAKMMK